MNFLMTTDPFLPKPLQEYTNSILTVHFLYKFCTVGVQ